VNCWVKADSAEEAKRLASDSVRTEGWVIEAVEQEIRLVTEPDEETRERFDQAEIDGSCYVFHTWPIDDRSEEPLH
jgi:hypothetical protein